MKVFMTGGTGFVGSAVVRTLIGAGHEVLGLARSASSAAALTALGASAHRGDLEDPASLVAGAAACDGVAHLGFAHDFSRFAEVCAIDARAVEALAGALEGSQRPLVVTSGVALVAPGRRVTEADVPSMTAEQMPRVATELAVDAAAERGVRAIRVRLSPSVHGNGDHGFVPMLIDVARQTGRSAWIGTGENRWNAVHKDDAARVFLGALEQGRRGEVFHAVAECSISVRSIAEAIGAGLGCPTGSVEPDDAEAHFGWLASFAGLDCPASSERTRARLDWSPQGPGLLDDLASGSYF